MATAVPPRLLLLPGAELSLMVESSGLLNDLFPFPSILDVGYPIFDIPPRLDM
jgi:hypothetical protein